MEFTFYDMFQQRWRLGIRRAAPVIRGQPLVYSDGIYPGWIRSMGTPRFHT